MDIILLKKLIKVVESSNITEFSVQEGDLKIKISKNSRNANNTAAETQISIPSQTVPIQQAAQGQPQAEPEKPAEQADSNLHEVCSPIVGTFYRAPAPDADPYVQVGDVISEGSVLCIVEAMKLMNEIESDASGKIVKILVDNATPVEYNQPLFLVQKD